MSRPSSPPRRGDPAAYERYLASMDAAMKQKVAVTAAYLLCRGRVADMGMGSGAGSEALAALYPELDVVGVDLDPTMVTLAKEKYRRDNLSFVAGDIAKPVFDDESVDGIFNSSVLHHVTSFGGYRHGNAADALMVQVKALKAHGVLVVRDFVDPTRQGRRPESDLVLLDVLDNDGAATDDPRSASTAALFERFAREFRSLHDEPGFTFERGVDAGPKPAPGFRRFRTTRKLAAEFLLRKDYRADWEAEVKEEYTYFTQERFEQVFASLGLRLLASAPIHNPWIVRNRLDGKCALYDEAGVPLDLPPTNYVIAGERVLPGEGVRFEVGADAAPLGYLEMTHYREQKSGRLRDLVRKPNLLVDIVPTFTSGPERFVVARMSYPRPLLAAAPAGEDALDGGRPSPYVTEPLNARQGEKPIGQTVEEALFEVLGLGPEAIHQMTPGPLFYPSPGGIQEEVRTVFVEIDEMLIAETVANFSGWSTSGRVRALEARQVLRAAQVGGLPDARLELAVHALFAQEGLPLGPYLGEALEFAPATVLPERVTTWGALEARPRRRAFARASESAGFLELAASTIRELDGDARVVGERVLERVVPRTLSPSTLAAAVVARIGGEFYLGVDDDDLPAAQAFSGSSALLVTPAWRLPRGLRARRAALEFARERLRAEYGIQTARAYSLGGSYHPAPGITPEVVHPYAFEVQRQEPTKREGLRWVPLREIRQNLPLVPDMHLRVVAMRAAHALGLLD